MTAKPYGSSSSSMIHQVYTKASTTVTVSGYLISISIKVYNFEVLDEKPVYQDTELYHTSKHREVR